MPLYCADPLQKHKRKIYKDLRPLSTNLFTKCGKFRQIKEETILCGNCRKLVSQNPELLDDAAQDETQPCEETQSEDTTDTHSTDSIESLSNIPEILEDLKVTPIKKRKLTFKY